MGGSRRRLKRNAPKVRVGVQKHSKKRKAPVPLEVSQGRPQLAQRLNITTRNLNENMVRLLYLTSIDDPHIPLCNEDAHLTSRPDWDEEDTLNSNYERCGLVVDPNALFAGAKVPVLKTKEEQLALNNETYSDDDELRAGCNQERKAGKAKPPRLSSHQREIIAKLVLAHGDDYGAMVVDTTLNKMQHSAGKLRLMVEAFNFWGADSKHDFKGPNKPYKRL